MKKSKITGIAGTLIVHVIVIALLFWLGMDIPEKQEEGGVPVMMGNAELAQGSSDPYMMTEVDVAPQPEYSGPEITTPQPESEQQMITQQDEPLLQVKEEKPKPDKKVEKPVEKVPEKKPDTKVEKPKVEKTEAEKRAEAEKAAAEAAANKIAGAFGKGAQMGNKGSATSGQGVQGKSDGNSTTGGMADGAFDLNGRSLGEGGLPVPVYNVQEEGRVVVTIVVNPAGKVISTSINKRTNTVNPVLRKAAEDAARKARFNTVDGVDNQSGTITYHFRLR
ncbi:energy transducer TonB [Bacteroides sp.]|uniref:energy transducer TonB family protein n=1 Tax=Bacteroides sp. TaxID=29523 RepID=UPI0025C6409D|nr:energy transducer TonB [Bacteroides sp.]